MVRNNKTEYSKVKTTGLRRQAVEYKTVCLITSFKHDNHYFWQINNKLIQNQFG